MVEATAFFSRTEGVVSNDLNDAASLTLNWLFFGFFLLGLTLHEWPTLKWSIDSDRQAQVVFEYFLIGHLPALCYSGPHTHLQFTTHP